MSEAYRHHRASHPAVIFIEVPAAGSPKEAGCARPPKCPHQDRTPWNPQRAIPSNRKAEGLKRLIDSLARQDEIVREFSAPISLC